MKKISFLILIFLMFSILSGSSPKAISNSYPIKFGVLLYKEKDDYIKLIKNELLKIESKNKGIIEITIYDANNNQELQNSQIEKLLSDNVDVILLNLVDVTKSKEVIEKIKEKDIPVIFFNREPSSLNWIESYKKSIYLGTEACESGNIQGEIILRELRKNDIKDKNDNKILDIILLSGEVNNIEAQLRSECVIRTLNNNGINTNLIAEEHCNWERECAEEKIQKLFSEYGEDIELIISNNDSMAIGALKALQKYGYNIGNSEKYIPIVGVDGLEEAKQLINKGELTGTVIQDSEATVRALYRIGINFVEGRSPLENTEYNYDVTGVGVRIPYNGYIIRN
ncbi:galactose ABC transporter substrate-binding protein [Clostridium nigeriense]|uniref:galactose ABC transporter substrate-binding protein n=1 Tax=Clostridium nigeriense TaxID=1805470 RepID=UPI0008318A5E|nr:galactose ABC transporter substrate-binding protein [Clostridium nigeriense]